MSGERLRGTLDERRTDIALLVLAALFGAVSLTYPLGRDQGLYFYVGREWALRGAVPYRDLFDHKTPAIYVVHAACILLFGERPWGIRLADLGATLGIGWLAGGTVVRALRLDREQGFRGLGAFAASLLFFGFLDFKA